MKSRDTPVVNQKDKKNNKQLSMKKQSDEIRYKRKQQQVDQLLISSILSAND